ncbi:hypothetical protein HGP05_08425 [Streptococcus sanguinis]|uniref:Uncharacterized protein n=1 Tax=Streptococcus sanguinis TaxID=1305 RepID=A0A7Y0YRN4_STRSA|nr:hypothetical protein [Streptococcus sanguinis]
MCKIMGLNPEDFKGVNYFPYDLVAECGNRKRTLASFF